MSFRNTDKCRVWGWLLTLALLAMALPSGASWQCLNGTPCPRNCPMLRPGSDAARRVPASVFAASHCSHCSSTTASAPLAHSGQCFSCSTPQCVLRVPARPMGSLTAKQIFTMPMLALPPPAPAIVAPVETLPLFTSASPACAPQHFQRPASGRAPPTRLS